MEVEKGRIGKLQVLKSNAGYYIGRLFIHENGCTEPYSRESGYYRTAEEAQTTLDNNDFFRG